MLKEFFCKLFKNYGVLGIALWIIGKLFLFICCLVGGNFLVYQFQKKLFPIVHKLDKIENDINNISSRKVGGKKEDHGSKLLIWFCAEWLNDGGSRNVIEFQRKQQFYQWLEANYQFHVKKQKKNRDEYFESARKGGKYEAISKGGSWLHWVIGVGAAAVAGSALKEKVLVPAIDQFGLLANVNPAFKLFISFLMILAAVFCFMVILYGFIATTTIHYTKKMEDIQQKKETWVRHTEALYAYQFEMMNYIMNSGEYKKYLTKQRKEDLLIERMIAAWEHNGIRFQSNMKKVE